ncbi:hypothetical protein D9M68_909750 [compost metagenome]
MVIIALIVGMAFFYAQFIHIFREDLGVSCPVHVGKEIHFRFPAGPAPAFICIKQGFGFGEFLLEVIFKMPFGRKPFSVRRFMEVGQEEGFCRVALIFQPV